MPTRTLPSWLYDIARFAAISIVYYGAGKFGLTLASVHVSATAVWPPTGIAIATLLLLGYRMWPAIFLGAFLVNITTQGSIPVVIGIAAGNTLEGVLGAFLVNRFAHGRYVFNRPQDVLTFAVLAGMVSTALSATIGVLSLTLGGFSVWENFWSIWFTWWTGDAVGCLLFGSLFVLLEEKPRTKWTLHHFLEAILLLFCLTVIGFLIFGGFFEEEAKYAPVQFLYVPFLLWAAFHFRQQGAAVATLLLSGIAIWGTLHGHGPFVVGSQNASLLLLQSFTGVISVTIMTLAAALAEREKADRRLHEIQVLMEQKRLDTAKSEFVTLASHELRTPLSGIRWSLELLQQPTMGPLTEKQALLVQNSLTAAASMAETIGTMLLLSQIEARKIKPRSVSINLCTVLRGVEQEFAEACNRKKIQCAIRCSENLAFQSDDHLLSALLSILIDNAIAYTPNGGTITLAAEALDGHVRCTVEDTGIGIPKADRANFFTKFYRAGNALRVRSTGTGLGLYLATKITSLLHGSITFVSKENKGTTFSVTFPRHP